MSTRLHRLLKLGMDPPSGPFRRLYLYGKLSHHPPQGPQDHLRFDLDTGARFLYLTERMLRYADPGAIEFVQQPLPGNLAGRLVPRTDFEKYFVRVGGYCWTYGIARVSFLLFEVGPQAEAIHCFTDAEARVLSDVVCGEWVDKDNFFHIKKSHPPKCLEDIHTPIVGCDPVLQQCVLLADCGTAGRPSEAHLALGSEMVRTARSWLLAGLPQEGPRLPQEGTSQT